MPRHPILGLLLCLLLAGIAAAQAPQQAAFYVNGATGINTPTAGIPPAGPLGWTPCGAAATPVGWKTIGYAIQQVANWLATTPTAVPSAVLYVEGGQAYSAATNGEVFPIVAHPLVALEGTFCNTLTWPELRPATGQAAIQLTPSVVYSYRVGVVVGSSTYLYPSSNFRYLQFVGGSNGIAMGSAGSARHRSRIEECVFLRQTGAGVAIQPDNTTGDDPKVYRSRFEDAGSGVLAAPGGDNCAVAPDVEDCSFVRCGAGVQWTVTYPAATVTLRGGVRACSFESCSVGVSIWSGGNDGIYDCSVGYCRFTACATGLDAHSAAIPFPYVSRTERLSVSSSVFDGCQTGMLVIRPSGAMGDNRQTLNVSNITVRNAATGIRLVAGALFDRQSTLDDVTITGCQTGCSISAGGDPAIAIFEANRWRISDCGVGIIANIDCTLGYLRLVSSMVVRCSGVGILYAGFPGSLEPGNFGPPSWLYLTGVTNADNGIGLQMMNQWSGAQVWGCAFGGNTADFQLAANVQLTVGDSCLQATSWPGSGNLSLTDPLFLRPNYQLAPTSPCVDAGGALAGTDFEGDPRVLASASDIGADEFDPDGSARPYGTGGFGRYNVFPRIGSPTSAVQGGQPLQVDLSGAIMPFFGVTSVFSLLMIGASEGDPTLPFDLTPLLGSLGILPAGFGASYLWTDALATAGPFFTSSAGSSTATFTLPTVLSGMNLSMQWLCFMPQPYGVIASDGLRLTIR